MRHLIYPPPCRGTRTVEEIGTYRGAVGEYTTTFGSPYDLWSTLVVTAGLDKLSGITDIVATNGVVAATSTSATTTSATPTSTSTSSASSSSSLSSTSSPGSSSATSSLSSSSYGNSTVTSTSTSSSVSGGGGGGGVTVTGTTTVTPGGGGTKTTSARSTTSQLQSSWGEREFLSGLWSGLLAVIVGVL
jgi:cytoskeletal protein RodZ